VGQYRLADCARPEGEEVPSLVEFPLEAGGTVLVELANDSADGQLTRGLRHGALSDVADQANRTFEEAIDRIKPAAQSLIRRLRTLADAPEEVQVEFGLRLSAQAGAFIAAASTGANFRVTLMWRKESPSMPPDQG
jgi:hypothetical protein